MVVRIRDLADVMRSRRKVHGNDFPHLLLNIYNIDEELSYEQIKN